MDVDKLISSMKIITENTKIIQSNVSKIESEVSTLQSAGINVNASNQVTANSNNPVSSKAVYTYVNQNLNSGTFLPAGGITRQVLTVNDQGFSWQTPDTLPEGGTTGQVLTVNDQGALAWQTPGTYLPEGGTTGQILKANDQGFSWQTSGTYLPEGGTTGQILKVNEQGDAIWQTPITSSTRLPSIPLSSFQFDATVAQDIYVLNPNVVPVSYWSIQSATPPVTLNNGAAFVAPIDGTYNVNLSLAVVNSSLNSAGKYILYIHKLTPDSYPAVQDVIKSAVQTYDFTTASYDDTATVSGTTSIPLGGQTNANLVVSNGGTIPDNTGVILNGMLGNSTSYISLNDNSYFTGINGLNEFSIEMNFRPGESGYPTFFKMKSDARTEIVLERAYYPSGNDIKLHWRDNASDGESTFPEGYAFITLPDKTSFHHLILNFYQSGGVTIYINGLEHTPWGSNQNAFVLNTITSIELGGAGYDVPSDSGEECFRSFRFYNSAVGADEALNLYSQRQREISYNEIVSDGSASTIITHAEDFTLTTGDELHVLLGSSQSYRSYTLSSGANSGEPESTITIALNTENQIVASSYVLTANNSAQVFWEEAPKPKLKAYMWAATEVEGVGEGMVPWLPSPITSGFTMNNNSTFTPSRDGYYMATAKLTFTQLHKRGTVRIGKVNTVLPLTADRSYDFTKIVGNTYYDTTVLPDAIGDTATLVKDLFAGSGAIGAVFGWSGYEGGPTHFIQPETSDWTFPQAFSIELRFQLGTDQDGSLISFDRSVFEAYDGDPANPTNRISIRRRGDSNSKMAVWVANTQAVGFGFEFSVAFDKMEHVIVKFNFTDMPEVYVNGAKVAADPFGHSWYTMSASHMTGTRSTIKFGRNETLSDPNYHDLGTEKIALVAYYNTALTATQIKQLYDRRVFGLDILAETTGTGTVTAHSTMQYLTTTDSIGVHVSDLSAWKMEGDQALVIHSVD